LTVARRASRAALWWLAGGVATLLVAVVAAYFINPLGTATWDVRARLLGYMVYRISSGAMAPGLLPGDVVLVDAKAYWQSAPGRGDVIAFFPPDRFGNSPFVSRVVGVAGDRVELQQGTVSIDGLPQPIPPGTSPATGPGPGRDMAPLLVPPGHVFVLGDNRDHSLDGRYFGAVPAESVVGRMVKVMRQPQGADNGHETR
jgi:signal peptidase I